MSLPLLHLKKGEDRRLRAGHLWIYSNEIDIKKSALKNFKPGEEVLVQAANQEVLGLAYVNPHSLIAARLFSRNPKERLTAELLSTRLSQALKLRESLFQRPYYRLAFAESDALPGLVVDRFGNHVVAQCNTYGMEHKKDEIILALREILPNLQSVLWRNDSSIRKQEGLASSISAAFAEPPEFVQIEENEVLFWVPLWNGQKTGWFFDQGLNRARLRNYAKDKKVLDLFSYLGGFGLQAAAFGAKEVSCVDSSAFACSWITKNATLNQVQDKVQIYCDEAVPALKNLVQAKKSFDLIILDPPAFIKKQKDLKEGSLAYRRFNALALKLLSPGGILFSASCSMHLKIEHFTQLLQEAALDSKVSLQVLERGHQGPDHPVHLAIPETDYLKLLILHRRE